MESLTKRFERQVAVFLRGVGPRRPHLWRTDSSDAAKVGEPAYPLSYNGAGEGVAAAPPSNPPRVALPWRSRMGAPPPLPCVGAV